MLDCILVNTPLFLPHVGVLCDDDAADGRTRNCLLEKLNGIVHAKPGFAQHAMKEKTNTDLNLNDPPRPLRR